MRDTKKQPVIRRGQRVPYHKGTQSQIDARRGYVLRLMVRGVPKMLIHSLIKHTHNRQWRTVDRDIRLVSNLDDRWLTRTRGGHSQTSIPEALANLKLIYGDKQK